MRYEQGIAYVRPWSELSGELAEELPGATAATSTQSVTRPDGKDQAL
jgi:hypothetical protein